MNFLTKMDPSRIANRVLRGGGRNVAEGAAEGFRDGIIEATNHFFDKKAAPLAFMINCQIAERIQQADAAVAGRIQQADAAVAGRIQQAEAAAQQVGGRLIEQAALNLIDIKDQVKGDLEEILIKVDDICKDNLIKVDDIYKDNLRLTFDAYNYARAETILDLRNTLNYIDTALEERINQLFLIVTHALSEIVKIGEKYTPEVFRTQLFEPVFDRVDKLENQLYRDLDRLSDKFFQGCDVTVDDLRTKLLRSFIPVNKRAQIRNTRLLPVFMLQLTDIELYRYSQWLEKDKIDKAVSLNANVPIQQIVDCYIQMQINASRNYFKAKSSKQENYQQLCLKDWVESEVQIQFWARYLR